MLTAFRLVLSFSILFSTAPVGADDFCYSTDGLAELKALLTCQEDTNIASCAGIFTRVGGRLESERGRARGKRILAHNRSSIASALARKLHSVWRRPRLLANPEARLQELETKIQNGRGVIWRLIDRRETTAQAEALRQAIAKAKETNEPVFEPQLRLFNKRTLDLANLKYDELPPGYLRLNRKYARDMLDRFEQTKSYSDQAYFLAVIATKMSDPLKDVLMEGFSNAGREVGHGIVQAQMVALKEAIAEFFKGAAGLNTLAEMGLTAANTFAFLSATIRQVTHSTPVFCDEGNYINMQKSPWVEGCHTVNEINRSVIRFLDLPADLQLKYLQSTGWAVCPFYKELHRKLIVDPQPRFQSLQCKANKFILKTKMSDGSELDHRVLFYPGTQDIRQINIVPLTPTSQVYVTPLEMTLHGDVQNIQGRSGLLSRTVNTLRLYIMDAYDCCTSAESKYKELCMKAYNDPTAQVRPGEENFVSK